MALEEVGLVILYTVIAGAVAIGVYWSYRYLRPKLMVSTFKAALTLGVIENAAISANITNTRFQELIEKIQKIDYKDKKSEDEGFWAVGIDQKIDRLIKSEVNKALDKTLKKSKIPKAPKKRKTK